MLQKPITRLPINTAQEMFEKLKWEESRLAESWSVYDSYNFIVTAHHLYWDWIYLGHAASADQQHRARSLPDDAQSVFNVIRDVSNGSKHFQLTNEKSLKSQVVTEVTAPGCYGYDSYFEGDMVHFGFEDYFVSMAELSAVVIRYLEWIVQGTDINALNEMSAALAGMKLPPSA